MRVLIVADIVGGVGTYTRELVRELVARDVDVDLALLGEDRDDEFARLGARSCAVREMRLEWMDDPWEDVERSADWVAELCDMHRPDVLHVNTFTPTRRPQVPVLLTVHSCVLTWWRAVHGCDAPAEWNRYRTLARRAFDRAEVLAVPTRALLGDLTVVYGSLPRARVIPNGRAVQIGTPSTIREPLVVTVGRMWDEGKNVALLARAADAIDGRVVSIGPGGANGVDRRADGLERLGRLPEGEVTHWLSRAAVFAEPARYEPFGLAALEAALCGCALVLGDIPSLREVWGDAAAYVSPDDAASLADAVNVLLSDPERQRRAARAAYLRAVAYTPAATAKSYLDAYATTIGCAVVAA